jgi:hypothetical protein
MHSAKDERARPIGQTTWAGRSSRRLKESPICAFSRQFAALCSPATGGTSQPPKDQTEGAAQDICRFACWKMKRLQRNERKTQRLKIKLQIRF